MLKDLETHNGMFTGDTGLYYKAHSERNGFLYCNPFCLVVSTFVSMEGFQRLLDPSKSRGLGLVGD